MRGTLGGVPDLYNILKTSYKRSFLFRFGFFKWGIQSETKCYNILYVGYLKYDLFMENTSVF